MHRVKDWFFKKIIKTSPAGLWLTAPHSSLTHLGTSIYAFLSISFSLVVLPRGYSKLDIKDYMSDIFLKKKKQLRQVFGCLFNFFLTTVSLTKLLQHRVKFPYIFSALRVNSNIPKGKSQTSFSGSHSCSALRHVPLYIPGGGSWEQTHKTSEGPGVSKKIQHLVRQVLGINAKPA